MLILPDCEIQETIHTSEKTIVYRGVRNSDNLPLIFKFLNLQSPSISALTQYKQEYEITRSLNIDGVIKAYELRKSQNSLVILLEDLGAKSLKQWIFEERFSLEEFLLIAISVSQTIAEIHSANVIHKDINPSNIIYNRQTGQVKIIDFGISTSASWQK
jgi:serine/threonine protein kinase